MSMEPLKAILGAIFGKKQKVSEITFSAAIAILEDESVKEQAALSDLASKKFAEIRHLASSLTKNAQALEGHEIKVDEGNRALRQIVSTSQKNLSRHLRGLSNKIMPPQKIPYRKEMRFFLTQCHLYPVSNY
jgi:hypothetical protein